MAIPTLTPAGDIGQAATDSSRWDGVLVVSDRASLPQCPAIEQVLGAARRVDERLDEEVALLPAPAAAGGRVIFAPTGPLDRDYDDVRRFGEAAELGARRARDAGARRLLVVVPSIPADANYGRALEVTLLGVLSGLWQPLEAREARGEDATEPVREVGLAAPDVVEAGALCRVVAALEQGRRLARDLGGSDPERMRPAAFAALCVDALEGTPVKVEVVDDGEQLRADYPLLAAVARASERVVRHRPRVVRMSYEGAAPKRTLLLAGKGVTYDTGGADLKVGGHMAGMSRDKGGAAAVAGLLRSVAALRPSGVRVVAELGLVRNSVGADAYVADEIVTSHAGVRVRVGNTDAEGRMVLADLLSHLRKVAETSLGPRLLSVATLTGHAVRAVGPYSIALDNGPAREARIAHRLAAAGEAWGEPFELSRLRREDYDFVKPRSRADDVIQCNNAASVNTNRGHQFPMAFLAIASGLVEHGSGSSSPLCYTHVDIGGSAMQGCDWQHGRPTAAPLVALAARWVLDDGHSAR